MALERSPGGRAWNEGSARDGDWPTLGEVLANLDGEVLKVARAPAGGGVCVSDVVILERTDPGVAHRGAIVLGVGLSPADGDAMALVDRAARWGAAAIVFRADGALPERIMDIADSLDVAVLTTPVEMTWGTLYSLLRTATVSTVSPGDGEPASAPVGDLFALADAIAAAVGGPVTIEDPWWRVLAYANLHHEIDDARRQTILGRTPPVAWQRRLDEAGVSRALRSGPGVVRFGGEPGGALALRLAAPVWAAGELLGSIWVAQADVPLGDAAEQELARAAEVAAIHLIAHRASDHVRRRARSAFVSEVLEGRVPPASAGPPMRADRGFTALAFARAPSGAQPPKNIHPDRILSIISLYCEDLDREALCALIDDGFWALVPTPRTHARERTLEVARKIVTSVERAFRVELTAAIGSSVSSLSEVPQSRRSAEWALRILARRAGAEVVVHIDEVQAHTVLLELLELAADRPSLIQGKVQAIVAHDREHGTSYTETLRAYLDASRDVLAAATCLGIHPNTLRYRVRRVAEVFGMDLADPDERLVAELQLRLDVHAHGA